MGVSRSPQELARKLNTYGAGVARVNRTATEAAALVVKDVTVPLVRAATGGDLRLSGLGKSGRIGVRYDVKGNENATAIVKATGKAHLVERDVKAHPVASKYAPKGFGRSRARRASSANAASAFNALSGGRGGAAGGLGWDRRAVISFGGVTVRYAVQSGGSKGRHPYERGFDLGAKLAPREYAKHQRRVMTGVFR